MAKKWSEKKTKEFEKKLGIILFPISCIAFVIVLFIVGDALLGFPFGTKVGTRTGTDVYEIVLLVAILLFTIYAFKLLRK